MQNKFITLFSKSTWRIMGTFSVVFCIACERNAPRQEPDLVGHQCVLAGVANNPTPVKKIPGIINTKGPTCLSPILQILAHVYKEEIDTGTNTELQELIKKLTKPTSTSKDVIQESDVKPFKDKLPELDKGNGNIISVLKCVHNSVPFLGEILYSVESSVVAFKKFILEVYTPLNQDGSTVPYDLSKLIRVNQHLPNGHISAGMLFNGSATYIEPTVFYQLPDKLCISLVRDKKQYAGYWDQRDLVGTTSITIQHDIESESLNPESTSFTLAAFLVLLYRSNQLVAFVQSDKQWYCANNEQITCVTYKEAIHASKKGTLFFYRKKI